MYTVHTHTHTHTHTKNILKYKETTPPPPPPPHPPSLSLSGLLHNLIMAGERGEQGRKVGAIGARNCWPYEKIKPAWLPNSGMAAGCGASSFKLKVL